VQIGFSLEKQHEEFPLHLSMLNPWIS